MKLRLEEEESEDVDVVVAAVVDEETVGSAMVSETGTELSGVVPIAPSGPIYKFYGPPIPGVGDNFYYPCNLCHKKQSASADQAHNKNQCTTILSNAS